MSTPIPETMTAIVVSSPGGPEVLEPRPQPVPRIGREEVLIRVVAAGVNRPDLLQRQGKYPPPPGAPDTLGLEVAGTIVAVGVSVTGWGAGDAVCALLSGGGYAEYCAAPAVQCLPVPAGFSMIQAAACPRRSSPSGRTSSSADGSSPARPSSSTAARAASVRRR